MHLASRPHVYVMMGYLWDIWGRGEVKRSYEDALYTPQIVSTLIQIVHLKNLSRDETH